MPLLDIQEKFVFKKLFASVKSFNMSVLFQKVKVLLYVDDYLVHVSHPVMENDQGIEGLLKLFSSHAFGLKFTHETSLCDRLQFFLSGMNVPDKA